MTDDAGWFKVFSVPDWETELYLMLLFCCDDLRLSDFRLLRGGTTSEAYLVAVFAPYALPATSFLVFGLS